MSSAYLLWAAAEPEVTPAGGDSQWLARLGLIVVIVLLFAMVLWLMSRAWRSKAAGQSQWPAPRELPAPLFANDEGTASWSVPATAIRYLGSSQAGDWLARVVVHQLGVPSQALLAVDDSGVWIQRQGARSFYIPAGEVLAGRADRAVAGRAYEEDGVTIVRWRLGDIVVDSGFRIVSPERQAQVIAAVESLVKTTEPTRGGQS